MSVDENYNGSDGYGGSNDAGEYFSNNNDVFCQKEMHYLLVISSHILSQLCNFQQLGKLSKCCFNCTACLNHFPHWACNYKPSVETRDESVLFKVYQW